ncbi:MAG TPA: hypothetical protein VMT16_07540 [Thermoanaerobaculia bacterium]|nr:hypothetical protein [Thermoanaerobaculia bacterium]
MRRTPLLACLLLLAAAPAAADRDLRTDRTEIAVTGATRVHIEVPVGEVEVRSVRGDTLRTSMTVRCGNLSRRCRERAEPIRLQTRREGSTLVLDVAGFPRSTSNGSPSVRLAVMLPERLGLQVELGVGEATIRDVAADVRLEVGVGEARVRVPREAVRSVSIEVGVGEADLRPKPPRTSRAGFLFLGNDVRWDDGPGHASVDIEVGVGEGRVELE